MHASLIKLRMGQEILYQLPGLPFHLYTLPVVGFLLIFRKFASSSTKMCIRGQQLFTVFELKNLTQEISFTWSLHLSISTCRKRSMNNNCQFRVAPLQLFIWSCVFPDTHMKLHQTLKPDCRALVTASSCLFVIVIKEINTHLHL